MMHYTTEDTRVLTLGNEACQKTKDGTRQKYTAANGTLSAQTVQEGEAGVDVPGMKERTRPGRSLAQNVS